MRKLNIWFLQANDFKSTFTSWAHWLLAITYFETVMILPLIVNRGQTDQLKSKEQRVKKIIRCANIMYYCSLLIFLLANEFWARVPYLVIVISDVVAPLTPCFLLMFSICYLRKVINQLDQQSSSKKFFANESLMLMHLTLFLGQLIALIVRQLLAYNSSMDTNMTRVTYCRVMRSLEATIYFGVIVSMGIVFLITYMSVELSKPLTDYWQRFLIIYQEKLEKVGEVLEEHHRAQRAIKYHNEAVKDANRQIEILRAMT